MYDFNALETKIAEIHDWLKGEYMTIRTGRATPSLLDTVQVEAYGSKMPLAQMANVGVEDARTLRVTPFDSSLIKDIERAIVAADFGVGVSAGSDSIRISFPELTGERRQLLIKTAKEKLEDARKSLRGARDDVWNDIQKQEKNGDMSEDEKFTAKEAMEKIVKEAGEAFEASFKKKEAELNE